MIIVSLLLAAATAQALPDAQTTDPTVPIVDAQSSAQQLIDLARADLEASQWQAAALRLHAARERMKQPPAVLAYDEGVAWARSGDLHQARTAFESALQDANSTELAADAAYNLGNVANELAQPESSDADQQAAIDALTAALNHYRQAIKQNPRDVDARANAQLTWQQLEQLKQQQQEQQQDEQEQDQNQQDDNQDQQEPSEEQQQDEQQQDEQQQDEQQQDEQDQGGQQDQTQDQNQENDNQDRQEPSEEQQQDEQEQGQQQEPRDQQQEQQDQKQEPQESAMSPAASKPMTREEAQRLLQRVRDRERERAKKDADHAPGRPATGKDW